MELRRLSIFVHAPSKLAARELLRVNEPVERNWIRAVEKAGEDPAHAVCVIQGGGGDAALVDAGREHLGERCIVDPHDDSDATRLLLAEDMERAFSGRGSHGEWNLYELWSSNNARRWAEGLKREMEERGLGFDPDAVEVETFGNWTGCHHKYTNFLARYLDLPHPAVIHAETGLCSLKDFPMPAREFVECAALERGVLLFLFRREDGAPMAQFWDGLRGVWEPPHTARVEMDPGSVDLFTLSPNAFIAPRGASRKVEGGFVADVGDGAHPAFTTVVGGRIGQRGQVDMEGFAKAMKGAVIKVRNERETVYNRVEI